MRRDRNLLDRLSPEARLLLLAAGPSRTDPEIGALLQSHPVDWDTLIAMSDRERATAVVWRRIKPFAPASIPRDTREQFERMAMIADFSASYLEQRIGETLAHLNSQGIRGLLLKGSAMAASVYGSFAERPMGDVDIVVDRGRSEDAFQAFQEVGWRWDPEAFPRARYHGHHHFPPLLDRSGTELRLELHTDLFVAGSPFSLNGTQMLAEGRSVRIGAGEAVIPSHEHLLLHTCIHYTWSHMMLFGAWRTFRDVIALAQAGVDWDRFESVAKGQRAESASFWTMRLAERLVGASLPPAVMERLSASTSARWMGVCERHAAREMFPNSERCPSQWLRRTLWETAIRPGPAGHGSARPWLLDDMAPENLAPESRGQGVLRAFRHVPRLGAWIRYARLLAG